MQNPGSVTVIPPRTTHRFEALYGRVTLIEVSTPDLLDVVRLQDDYKRE
jgi:mannose-6-phosphate isomerase-like protein (cupin superfamily)